MKCNVGSTDRILRILFGMLLFGLGVYFKNWWGALGIVPIITALIGWCPAYVPLKISTKKEKKEQ